VFLAFTGTERWLGRTPGKFVFSLAVVGLPGDRPARSAAVGRFFLAYPFLVLPVFKGLGGAEAVLGLLQVLAALAAVFCFLRFGRRTHADLLTRTRVIYRAPPGAREKATTG
jgi:hypothetical protein